jgi:hypothetical protein
MTTLQPFGFEHLVEINDPEQPLIEALTRAQLWRGLLLRVEHPQAFMPWLDSCEVQWQPDGTLKRALVFGTETVRDVVRFELGVALECEGRTARGPFGLRIAIEEPAPGHLFLRFTYSVVSEVQGRDDPYGAAVREAWQRADEDTVFRIRQLAAAGGLED